MKLYNTLSRQVETFTPYQEKEVTMYTCGPTVYHFAHIGNLRSYLFEDILERSLNYLGYQVKRAMNITDVGHMTSDGDTGEDKMLKGAKREHKTVYEIADFYTQTFFHDLEKLNIKKPEIIEKASDHIDVYIKMIEHLLEKDYAYLSGGNVYFDIAKANQYYQLSGKKEEDLIIGAREDVSKDAAKRNPYDFGLWFTISKFEDQAMKWDSPWGVGYPGWHIECSGIALTYLGEYLDIHCGGVDNIFPHHTNEIAQSEGYLGHKWCQYWCHGEHLNDQSGKMSKSNGEFLTLSLLEEKGYDPLIYRFFSLQSHYRNQLVFSYDALDGAKLAYQKLLSKAKSITEEGTLMEEAFHLYQNKMKEALGNDLNTSNALTLVYDVFKDESLTGTTKRAILADFDTVLGLDLLKEEKQELDASFQKQIEELIETRKQAKALKDFAKADSIRQQLEEMGVLIKDTREKTEYEIKK